MQLTAEPARSGPKAAIKSIRAQAVADLATVPEYAAAIRKSERSVWSYIKQGLPVTYIGRTPYVVLSKSLAYWAARSERLAAPNRGRPRERV